MRNNSLYGIGIGPGDPELITIKALKVIERENIIFVPDSGLGKKSLALEMIEKIVDLNGKEVIDVGFLNRKGSGNSEVDKREWEIVAKRVNEYILKGSNVVYLTLGDPLVYSTYIYLICELKKINKSINIITIPGISSYVFGHSVFNIPIVKKDDSAVICPATYDKDKIEWFLDNCETIIIMKIGKKFFDIYNTLKMKGLLEKSYFFKKLGFKEELKFTNMSEIDISHLERDFGNLSTIIVKRV